MSPEEVRARLGGPELKRLFEVARHAVETRGVERAVSVTLSGLSVEEREALAGLHGWRELPGAERVRVSLGKLDAALRASVAHNAQKSVQKRRGD